MGFKFIIKQAPPSPPSGDNFFDNTYWDDGTPVATWTGVKWTPGVFDSQIILSDIGVWAAGYDPVSMDITIDDIQGGSGNFAIEVAMDNGGSPVDTGVPISDGGTYSMDLSAGGDTPTNINMQNEAGAGNGFSITNIVFYT